MAATEPLCSLFSINPHSIPRREFILLENDLLLQICDELIKNFQIKFKDYLNILKLTKEAEEKMLEENLISLLIKDILLTEDYTLEGIATFTDTPVDVLNDILLGLNKRPSATLLKKTIQLHRSVQKDLYETIGKNIILKYVAVPQHL